MVQGMKFHASNAGVVVWPLGREPRPHMLCGTGKIKKKKFKWAKLCTDS